MDKRHIEIERFDEAIDRIRSAFPWLLVELAREHPDIHASAELPRQAGLDFDVGINLQNADELHLTVGEHFWMEWFPCGEQRVFEGFIAAALGVISGEFRVVERYVFGRAVSAQLQRPDGTGGWRAVARWANLGFLLPAPRTTRILRNDQNRAPSETRHVRGV